MDAVASDHPLVPADPALPRAVESDAPCLRCGYNIRGLGMDGRCPECGWEVARSLMGNLYEFAPEEFVERLHRGALIAEIATLALFPVSIVAAIVGGIMFQVGGGELARRVGSSAVSSACVLALMYGWWLLSSPDPSGDPSRDPRARRVLRVTLVIAAVGAVAQPLLALGGGSVTGLMPSSVAGNMGVAGSAFALGVVASWLVIASQVVQLFASMVYVRRMAARLPDALVASRAKLLIWGPVWTLVAFVVGVGSIALLATLGFSANGALVVLIPGMCLSGLAVLVAGIVFYVLYAMLLDRLRAQLGKAIARGRCAPIMAPPGAPVGAP